MRSINVPLPEDGARQLVELARREFRQPREQAAALIVDGLKRAGLEVESASAERAALAPEGQPQDHKP
jgi:hypothetical protein